MDFKNSISLRRTSRTLKSTFSDDWVVDTPKTKRSKSSDNKDNKSSKPESNESISDQPSNSRSSSTSTKISKLKSLKSTKNSAKSQNKSSDRSKSKSLLNKSKSVDESINELLDRSVNESSAQQNEVIVTKRTRGRSKKIQDKPIIKLLDRSVNKSPAQQNKIIVVGKKRGRPSTKAAKIVVSNKLIKVKTKKLIKPCKKTILKKIKKYVRKLPNERKKRVFVQEPVEDAPEYRCSACDEIFVNKDVAYKHTLNAHNGLARLNDPNNEFTEREILAAFKSTIELKKVLNCLLCNKLFSSALGLKFHYEICGKSDEELIQKCEKCGNVLKITSMRSHSDMHKRREEKAKQTLLKSINEDDKLMYDDLSKRPIRKSAKKANEFFKSTAVFGDDSDADHGGKRKRRKNSDDDNFDCNLSTDDESQTSIDSFGVYNDQSSKNCLPALKLNISMEKSFVLFKLWQNHIKLPDKLVDAMKDCDTDYHCNICQQVFANQEILTFHYLKCNNTLDTDWSCRLCDYVTESNLIALLKHLIDQHLTDIEEIPNLESIIRKTNKKSSQINLSWLKEAEHFSNQHFSESVFENWIFDERLVTFLNENESEHYLPERKCSAKFKFRTCNDEQNKTANQNGQSDEGLEINGKNDFSNNEKTKETISDQNIDVNNQQTLNNDWKTMNLFESLVSRHHVTFYTGGPVYSGAWCPFPKKTFINRDQILCLSTNVKNRVYNVFDCEQYPGCLQFWNFGQLKIDSCDSNYKPVLEFIIAHNYGTICEIVWCPGGTSYSPKTNDSNGRLGLLALACTDGYIRILSIPLIEELNQLSSTTNKLKVIKLQPIVILDKHPIGSSVFNKPTICKTLSWSQTEKQRFIVAGYGCGLISTFDLQTNSSLLKKTNSTGLIELKPKKSWIAHGACVNCVKWLPLVDCSYIVSGGFDRVIKIWSLEDMATNIVLPKKAIITNVHWLSRYIGCYFSSDDCYTNLHNNVTFRDLTLNNFTNSLSRHKCSVWDFDISTWTNTEVGVDASGEAVLSVYVKPKNGKKYSKARPYECLPVYRLTYESLTEGEQINKTQNPVFNNKGKVVGNVNYLIDSERPIKRTLDEMINSYGLVFNDVDLSLYSRIPISEFKRLKASDNMNYPRLGDYPLISLNKVQINPNRSSSNYIFTSGESGLSRVSYVEFLKNPFFTIYNK